jgi:hypothetical protein
VASGEDERGRAAGHPGALCDLEQGCPLRRHGGKSPTRSQRPSPGWNRTAPIRAFRETWQAVGDRQLLTSVDDRRKVG